MTRRQARLLGGQTAAICRVLFDDALRRMADMESDGTWPDELKGAPYQGLSLEKRLVVDEVIAAANEMLAQLSRGASSGVPPHLKMLPFMDQLRGIETIARTQPGLAAGLEMPARETVRSMLDAFGRDGTCLDSVDTVLDVPANSGERVSGPSSVEAFSAFVSAYLDDLTARNRMSEKDIMRYRRMLWFFQKVIGDRPIDAYQPRDIRKYVSVLQRLPTRFQPEAVDLDADGMPAAPPSATGNTALLSSGTVASYLAPVKAVFRRACEELNIADPCNGLRLEKPRKNRPSRSRPLPIEILNRAFVEGRNDGSLVALLMPLLGVLTARRIGLLTYLNTGWLEKIGNYYLVRPTETVVLPGRTARTPIKTDESMVPFALHQELVRLGIVELMESRGFLFAEAMSTSNPPAALSKRVNKQLQRAGARGRAYGETFHSIRSRGITHYRAQVPQAVRLQAGHAARDEHEAYDWAEIDHELLPTVATVPLPVGLQLAPFSGIDFERAISLEKRLASARQRRATSRGIQVMPSEH